MIELIRRVYRTGPDRPPPEGRDPAVVRRTYERMRWSVFLSCMFGYGMFYTCRVNFSVVKKPLIDGGILDATQMGIIGSVMLVVYAIGKATNGFLADHSNISRFMSTGLLISALANLAIGFINGFVFFAVLWGISGWFQSMGSAPSIVSITHWFSRRERGTRYGVWSTCHSIGEGLTFVGTAALVSWAGWRWGFWGPGLVCVVVALVLLRTLKDRPLTYGLPHVADYKGDERDPEPKSEGGARKPRSPQLRVLQNPYIWLLGMASACVYVARYGMNNWGVLVLQESKGYSLIAAGTVMGAYPVAGLAGAVVSGIVSDRLFHSDRNRPALLFGLLQITALVAFFWIPPGHIWADATCLAAFGFALGALLVYLGGLMAVDLSPQNAAGAAMGVVGMFSYMGAAIQDTISGVLIDRGSTVVLGAAGPLADAEVSYDFSVLAWFWIGASVVSLLLAACTWGAGPR